MIARILAVMLKEIRQMRRDRLTLGMMLGIPLMQLFLFGYAINTDPRHLKLAIEMDDHSAITRTIDRALRNSSYFIVTDVVATRAQARSLLDTGAVQFLLTIPHDFTRDLIRGERPQLLLEADSTDPSATGNAVASLNDIVSGGLAHDLIGPLGHLAYTDGPVEIVIHREYNPEGITSHNIVPGLLAIVLSMTMVMMTAMAVTRERERGTMENLLAMPLRPIEVMIGKIMPYLVIGMVQTAVILVMAALLFDVPFLGSPVLLLGATLVFIAASLALGFTFSTLAQTQLQAMQMSFFYMLPSILLSGFMFPFNGMPGWAQALGQCIPVTHFLRIVRGIMLKGWGLADSLPQFAILLVMLVVLGTVAIWRYRDTLD